MFWCLTSVLFFFEGAYTLAFNQDPVCLSINRARTKKAEVKDFRFSVFNGFNYYKAKRTPNAMVDQVPPSRLMPV